MFKWVKVSGCNCCPLEEGTEKYILNVGDVWGGVVQSHVCKNEPGKVYWESFYTVCDKDVSSQSGGPHGRNENMQWIEDRISEALSQMNSARIYPDRCIKNALYERDPITGEFEQKEII